MHRFMLTVKVLETCSDDFVLEYRTVKLVDELSWSRLRFFVSLSGGSGNERSVFVFVGFQANSSALSFWARCARGTRASTKTRRRRERRRRSWKPTTTMTTAMTRTSKTPKRNSDSSHRRVFSTRLWRALAVSWPSLETHLLCVRSASAGKYRNFSLPFPPGFVGAMGIGFEILLGSASTGIFRGDTFRWLSGLGKLWARINYRGNIRCRLSEYHGK